MIHNELCPKVNGWYVSRECQEFSTDGSRMGAHIAHTMGTRSERAIIADAIEEDYRRRQAALTGMDEEQADWESEN